MESKLERKVVDRAARDLGLRSLKLNVTASTGWPDRIFWVRGGRPALIEFKRPGETVRPKQAYMIQRLRKLGYDVGVFDDDDEAVAWLTAKVEAATLHEEGR